MVVILLYIFSVTFIHGVGKETLKENGRVIGISYKEKDSNEIKVIT